MVAKWLGFKAPAFIGTAVVRGWINFKSNHGFEPKFLQFMGIGFRSGFFLMMILRSIGFSHPTKVSLNSMFI